MSPTSGAVGVLLPNANVMTSVPPRWPRWRRLRSAIVLLETNAIESMADFTRSRWSTKSASARTDVVASDRRRRPASTTMPRSTVTVRRIGLDDLAHQPVPDDVHIRQVVERNSLDAGQDPLDLNQSRFLTRRQVDLGLVAGDDGSRIHAKTRQEHLHLRTRGVLCFVEDDEGVAQRTATHVGQRRDLDHAHLQCALHPLSGHHVFERVIEGAQVWIDLRLHVSREEAEALACFDRRPGEDDPFDALAHE